MRRSPVRRDGPGHGGPSWQEAVARDASPGQARSLTLSVLRSHPELRLGEVLPTVAAACAASMRGRLPGRCQTIDAGLAAIDARGPGWVDHRYPLEAVLPELAEAGFEPATIVALFNGNIPVDRLGRALQELFGDYDPHSNEETLGPILEECWRCPLPCCQARGWRDVLRVGSRAQLAVGPGCSSEDGLA